MSRCHFVGKQVKGTFLPSPSYIRKSIAVKVARLHPFILLMAVVFWWRWLSGKDGMILTGGNVSTRTKLCFGAILSVPDLMWTCPVLSADLCSERPFDKSPKAKGSPGCEERCRNGETHGKRAWNYRYFWGVTCSRVVFVKVTKRVVCQWHVRKTYPWLNNGNNIRVWLVLRVAH